MGNNLFALLLALLLVLLLLVLKFRFICSRSNFRSKGHSSAHSKSRLADQHPDQTLGQIHRLHARRLVEELRMSQDRAERPDRLLPERVAPGPLQNEVEDQPRALRASPGTKTRPAALGGVEEPFSEPQVEAPRPGPSSGQ